MLFIIMPMIIKAHLQNNSKNAVLKGGLKESRPSLMEYNKFAN